MWLPIFGLAALLAFAQPPKKAEAWYELGRQHLKENQIDAARSDFNAAIRADPRYAPPYLSLAALENTAKHWDAVIDVTARLLEFDAVDYPQAWLLNAAGNYNRHNFAAAEKAAREAERLDAAHNFPEAARLLGLILKQRGVVAGGEPDSPPTFSSDTSLALVRFQFHQNKGDLLRNLIPEDIEIREDGVRRKVALFEGPQSSEHTVPVEISLLFDCSASVDRVAVTNANLFRETLLDRYPNVSIAVYGFSDSLVRLVRPTRDPAALKKGHGPDRVDPRARHAAVWFDRRYDPRRGRYQPERDPHAGDLLGWGIVDARR